MQASLACSLKLGVRFEGLATRAKLPVQLQVFKYLICVPAGFHGYKSLAPCRSPLSTAIETASACLFRFTKVLALENSLTSRTVLEGRSFTNTRAHRTLCKCDTRSSLEIGARATEGLSSGVCWFGETG